MSFLAKFTIDNTTYNILECSFNFLQNTDSSGKPLGVTRGGQVKVKIEATGKNDFVSWMISPSKTKDCQITYYKRDAMSKLQEIKLHKAYCISFSQFFNSQDTQPLLIEMVLSAKKASFDDCDFENVWKV